MLENSDRSVCGVRMGKSGPPEHAELANQIQGFRIPDRWDASEKNKYMLFAGREVRIGKNCARGLEYGPRPCSRPRAQFFPNTDRPRPAKNVFIFFLSGKFFVDFLLQPFHTVCVRLTFRSSKPVLFTKVFKRRDSVFPDFKLSSKWFTFHGDF